MDEDMLSIGPFAAASGLSVRSLRHYDEIGLLRPTHVDDATGYRYYALSQLRDARTIRRLRDLNLPLEEIGGALHADEQARRALLRVHRARVATAAAATGWTLRELDMVIDGREALVPSNDIEIEMRDIPELCLAAVMRHLHDDEMEAELGRTFAATKAWLAERSGEPTDPAVAVFRSGDAPGWHFVEAGWPAPSTVESDGVVGIHLYPASLAAVHEHHGPYSELPHISPVFIAAVAERGLRPSQAIRVVYPPSTGTEEKRAQLVWPVHAAQPDPNSGPRATRTNR
jgi:DNA-binding transcriptional MerR regulator